MAVSCKSRRPRVAGSQHESKKIVQMNGGFRALRFTVAMGVRVVGQHVHRLRRVFVGYQAIIRGHRDCVDDAVRPEFVQVLQVRTGQGCVVVGQLVNGAQERKSVAALSLRMKNAAALHAADADIARLPVSRPTPPT